MIQRSVHRDNERSDTRLVDDWRDDTHDQIPVLAHAYRYHGLYVENILSAIVGPDVEVRVVLKGHTNEARDRILNGLRQRLSLVFFRPTLVRRTLISSSLLASRRRFVLLRCGLG